MRGGEINTKSEQKHTHAHTKLLVWICMFVDIDTYVRFLALFF